MELRPAQDFDFGGDCQKINTAKVVILACNIPT